MKNKIVLLSLLLFSITTGSYGSEPIIDKDPSIVEPKIQVKNMPIDGDPSGVEQPDDIHIVEPPKETVYSQGAVEKLPQFPSGEAALIKYIIENIKYPKDALENGQQGRVFIQFVVSKTGEVTDVRVMKGFGSKSCNDEAVRVIKSLPKWVPGMISGQPVSVSYSIPIVFKLDQK